MLKLKNIISKLRGFFYSRDEEFEISYGFLPEKYHFSHFYCLFLHDFMVETITSGEKEGIFNIRIDLKDENIATDFSSIDGGKDAIDWLEKNGYELDAAWLFYKQVFVALLSDFCHYIFEGLRNSKNGKLSVAFRLFRKPIKENLFYLEWMLARPGEFLEKFWKQDIGELDLKDIRPEGKIEIIKELFEKYDLLGFETAEDLYEYRYDKKSPESFEPLCQQAHHLITTVKRYKTLNTNFNFVFSTNENKEDQWEFIYHHLPLILFHAYQVFEALLKPISKRAAQELDVSDSRVIIGYYVWINSVFSEEISHKEKLDRLNSVLDVSGISCPKCTAKYCSSLQIYEEFVRSGSLTCVKCSYVMDLVQMHLEEADKAIAKHKKENTEIKQHEAMP